MKRSGGAGDELLVVERFAEFGGARVGERDGKLGGDATGSGGEDDEAVGEKYGFADGVGDEKGGKRGGFAETQKVFVEAVAGEFVEGGERFVEQEEAGGAGEGAGEGDAHFHAAGKLAGVEGGGGREVHTAEEFEGGGGTFGWRHAAQAEGKLDVALGIQPREEGGVLKDVAEAVARGGGGEAVNGERAGGGRSETGEEA